MVQVHPKLTEFSANSGLEVRLEAAFEIEMDEQWSYVGNKANQRWLWHTVDHATNTVLASTQMIGVLMSVTLRLVNMRLVSVIHRKSNVKI